MWVPPMLTYNQRVVTQERRNVMIIFNIYIYDIGGSKGRDEARAPARTGTLTFLLGQTEARRAEKNDFPSWISLLSLTLDQNNEEFKFATEKRKGNWSRNASRKCFWDRYWGREGQLLARSLCVSNSTQFLSRFLSCESPQPPFDKKRPLQRKGHAE